jgi:hypothetical protein
MSVKVINPTLLLIAAARCSSRIRPLGVGVAGGSVKSTLRWQVLPKPEFIAGIGHDHTNTAVRSDQWSSGENVRY